MGAESFEVEVGGTSMKEAFDLAVTNAQYDFGHAGYTGTIAEKDNFVDLTRFVAHLANPDERREATFYDEDNELWEIVDDKWGPAGGVELTQGLYLFFGWASS